MATVRNKWPSARKTKFSKAAFPVAPTGAADLAKFRTGQNRSQVRSFRGHIGWRFLVLVEMVSKILDPFAERESLVGTGIRLVATDVVTEAFGGDIEVSAVEAQNPTRGKIPEFVRCGAAGAVQLLGCR